MKKNLYERVFFIFKIFYIIVTATIVINIATAIRKWYIQFHVITKDEIKLLNKEAEIDRIGKEIERLKDPLYIERISREKLDMSREKEKIYKLRRKK